MNTKDVEQLLKRTKSEYQRLVPSFDVRTHGWAALRSEIDAQGRRVFVRMRIVRYAVIFACIVLLALVGTGGVAVASWRAQPGDFLYPMKTFSEQILASVQNRQEEESQEAEEEATGTPTNTPQEQEAQQIANPQELPVGKENIVKDAVEAAKEARGEEKKGIGQEVKGAATSIVEAVKQMVEQIHLGR